MAREAGGGALFSLPGSNSSRVALSGSGIEMSNSATLCSADPPQTVRLHLLRLTSEPLDLFQNIANPRAAPNLPGSVQCKVMYKGAE